MILLKKWGGDNILPDKSRLPFLPCSLKATSKTKHPSIFGNPMKNVANKGNSTCSGSLGKSMSRTSQVTPEDHSINLVFLGNLSLICNSFQDLDKSPRSTRVENTELKMKNTQLMFCNAALIKENEELKKELANTKKVKLV